MSGRARFCTCVLFHSKTKLIWKKVIFQLILCIFNHLIGFETTSSYNNIDQNIGWILCNVNIVSEKSTHWLCFLINNKRRSTRNLNPKCKTFTTIYTNPFVIFAMFVHLCVWVCCRCRIYYLAKSFDRRSTETGLISSRFIASCKQMSATTRKVDV